MSCIGEPISWLILERHAIGELPAVKRGEVEAHLARCSVCAQAAASIREDRPLPALPSRSRKPKRLPLSAWAAPAALAAAASLLFAVTPAQPPSSGVKGPGLALRLLTAEGPKRVVQVGEAVKVELTCAPEHGGEPAEVVVFDAEGPSRPLPPAPALECKNATVLEGAFAFDRPGLAAVCVVIGRLPPALSLDRERLPAPSTCLDVSVR